MNLNGQCLNQHYADCIKMPNPTKTNSEQVEEWEKEFENYFSNGYIQRISAIELKKQCKIVIKDILAQQQSLLKKEIIICAAVVATDGSIYRGHRHNNCLELIYELGKKQRPDHEAQGFITSENRYVDRKEAYKIQRAAGIPSASEDGYQGTDLYSEDLY